MEYLHLSDTPTSIENDIFEENEENEENVPVRKRYFLIRSPSKTYSIAIKPDIFKTPSVIFNKHRYFLQSVNTARNSPVMASRRHAGYQI